MKKEKLMNRADFFSFQLVGYQAQASKKQLDRRWNGNILPLAKTINNHGKEAIHKWQKD